MSRPSRCARRLGPCAPSSTTSSDLRRPAYGVLALIFLLPGCGRDAEVVAVTPDSATVTRVGDGDTFDIGRGRVRLVQIDAPELGAGECYGPEARRELERLVPPGTRVELQADLDLDDRDRYGRYLRYALVDGTILNVELVRRGAAAPYFRGGQEGVYADLLLDAVEDARGERRGMWGSCRVSWQPDRGVTTRRR